ncbi:MAG: toll/interleukin-1 receptor domain-containing protein [Kineosporiaceae bacterium]|jgi:hypothetical protein
MYFLSYASEDEAVALEIGALLRASNIETFVWNDLRGEDLIRHIETPINECEGFLALLSEDYLASFWCRKEWGLAIHREQALQERDPDTSLIRVLRVSDMAAGQGGFARTYDMLDCTTSQLRRTAVQHLLGNPPGRLRGAAGPALAVTDISDLPTFRNRDDELERVLRGLTTTGGPLFWLVVSPSQLGKTWFMDRLVVRLLEEQSTWRTRLVDVRHFDDLDRRDAELLLSRLFGTTRDVVAGPAAVRGIAQQLLRVGEPHLCMLDSAELLDRATAYRLRETIGAVHQQLQRSGIMTVRLGFVVASRREADWRGVPPVPRLSVQGLSEFKLDVITDALRDLSHRMGRRVGPAELDREARRAHRLTEGLPALLVSCLRWIKDEQWVGVDRLDSREVFDEIVRPYIQRALLSRDSLFPRSDPQDERRRDALIEAFHVLAPYRLFTLSHLRHHLDEDCEFKEALDLAQWSIEDLWRAVGRTALLMRPLDEPWQEIHGAIRRLVYRHFYKSDEDSIDAHRRARDFMSVWTTAQVGKEQIVGLVESLWHEASILDLSRPADSADQLRQTAQRLVDSLAPSDAYTVDELREAAARRVERDEELEDLLSFVPHFFYQLIRDLEGGKP